MGNTTSEVFDLHDNHDYVYNADISGPNNDGIIGNTNTNTSGGQRIGKLMLEGEQV